MESQCLIGQAHVYVMNTLATVKANARPTDSGRTTLRYRLEAAHVAAKGGLCGGEAQGADEREQ